LKKRKTYTGNYRVKNPDKYIGDLDNVHYRSSWERLFCRWCDNNNAVVMWGIEPISIPYFDLGTRKNRRYFPDFFVKFADGREYLIEIKPSTECVPPKGKKGTKNFILAEQTYATNRSKWSAAKTFCNKKGWKFRVMNENNLKEMGIKIMTPSKRRSTKKLRRKK